MNAWVSIPAVQIMIGTLPVTALLVIVCQYLADLNNQVIRGAWNLIEVKSLRADVSNLNLRIDRLAEKVSELAERVSKIEGKIEGHHVVLEN